MNSGKKNSKPLHRTPSWQKNILLGLLFISAITGYVGNAYLVFYARPSSQPSVTQKQGQLSEKPGEDPSLLEVILPNRKSRPAIGSFTEVRDLFRTAGEKEQVFVSFTFQGTLAGEQGTAIAIINDKPVAAGTEIQGVKVVAINDRVLVLEYKGETKKLGVGETVSVLME